MKRLFLFFITAVGITMYAAALDFGVNLSDATGLNGTNKELNVVQTNAAEVFVTIPTGTFSSVHLSGEARFHGTFPIKQNDPNKSKTTAQMLSLAQSFRIKQMNWFGHTAFNGIGLQWALGRIVFKEYSNKILYGLFDGARIGFTINHADIALAVGYTGLTYKADAKIRIDKDDTKRLNRLKTVLAPQRIFLLLSSSFQELLPAHSFGVDALAQFDLLKQITRTHTQYIIPYIHGRIGSNVSWKYWGAVQFGEDPAFFYSAASGLIIQYVNPDWRNFTVNGTIDWAAGDYDGTGAMRAFIPVTDLKHTVAAGLRYRDMLTAGLTVSVLPIPELLTELSYTATTAPNTKKIPAYTGSEVAGKVAYHLHNDFDILFKCGIFVPNKKIISSYKLRWLTDLAFTVRL